MKYYCYILSNKNRTVLFVGFTNDLKRRLKQHEIGNGAYFTKKYNAIDLVYFEKFDDRKMAKERERQLKRWYKEWKWNLIKYSNPNLNTLKTN